MIKAFRCPESEKLFGRESARRFKAFERVTLRKLQQLDFARQLSDLAVPGGNRLEALKGERMEQHSICINDQWRICFVWRDGDAYDVEIVDYH